MKPVRTLVLVASEGEARLLMNGGVGQGLSEIKCLKVDDFPDIDQEFTDAPGRQSAAPGVARHGFAAHESVREARREGFARHILAALSTAWGKGGYGRIVVAAAPRLLGTLREQMPKGLADAVMADMPKDLVKVPLRNLPAYFMEIAAF